MGFIHVQGLEEALILGLIDERTKNGNYQHLQDFIERIKPGIALNQQPLDDAIDEIELLGFTLCNVFELVDDDPSKYLPADDIEKHLGKEVNVLGYLVVTKPVRTVKNDTMYFHTFIDAKGDWLDAVCFPQIAVRYPVTGKGFYSMKEKVVEEFGVFTVEVSYCKKVGIKDRGQKGNELMKV